MGKRTRKKNNDTDSTGNSADTELDIKPANGLADIKLDVDADQHSSNWEEGPVQEVRQPRSIRRSLHRFAETTSLGGIPFIARSSGCFPRTFWALAFLCACAMTGFQLYEVFTKYYKAETSSSVKLGYASLEFPSVTVCNLNPIKSSQLWLAPDSFKDFLGKIQIDKKVDPSYSTAGKPTPRPPPPIDKKDLDVLQITPRPPSILTKLSGSLTNVKKTTKLKGPRRPIIRISGNWTKDAYDKYVGQKGDVADQVDYGSGERSVTHKIMEEYTEELRHVDQDTREKMGHDKYTLILFCTFNGRDCSAEDFTNIWIREYGNCYTFNSHHNRSRSLKARRSGVQYGLNLILYIEPHDVVERLVQGRGARMDIHPFNTMPFPVETGMSLPPGFQTFFGMRLMNITRLSDKFYGGCDDDGAFKEQFKQEYTVESCVNMCEDRVVARRCKCRRPAFPAYYSRRDLDRLRPCETDADMRCQWGVHKDASGGQLPCHCPQACTEQNYDVVASSNLWPTDDLWGGLVDSVCEVNDRGCYYLQEEAKTRDVKEIIRDNFLSVNVYYRDLNFQNIEQQPDYENSQFLSDIGGTIGLWLGASALTGVELLDLLARLIQVCCCKKRLNNQKSRKSSRPSGVNRKPDAGSLPPPEGLYESRKPRPD